MQFNSMTAEEIAEGLFEMRRIATTSGTVVKAKILPGGDIQFTFDGGKQSPIFKPSDLIAVPA